MEVLDLATFIYDRAEHKPTPISVDTLEVVYWQYGEWKSVHTHALAQICLKLKVRKLHFIHQDLNEYWFGHFFNNLAGYSWVTNTEKYPFLPGLRTIEVDYTETRPLLWPIFLKSRVKTMTWNIRGRPYDDNEIMDDPESILFDLNKIIDKMPHQIHDYKRRFFREFLVGLPWIKEPIPLKYGDPFESNRIPILVKTLERNRAGFKRAQDACVLILGLKRRRQFSQNKDTLILVVKLVWEKRFKEVWTDPTWTSN